VLWTANVVANVMGGASPRSRQDPNQRLRFPYNSLHFMRGSYHESAQVRYVVANVGGVPAWVYCYLRWFLPERLLDRCGIRCVAPFGRPFWLRCTYVTSVPVKKY
jgi:hypothetical protein